MENQMPNTSPAQQASGSNKKIILMVLLVILVLAVGFVMLSKKPTGISTKSEASGDAEVEKGEQIFKK